MLRPREIISYCFPKIKAKQKKAADKSSTAVDKISLKQKKLFNHYNKKPLKKASKVSFLRYDNVGGCPLKVKKSKKKKMYYFEFQKNWFDFFCF
jgi:hypothetical protein